MPAATPALQEDSPVELVNHTDDEEDRNVDEAFKELKEAAISLPTAIATATPVAPVMTVAFVEDRRGQ